MVLITRFTTLVCHYNTTTFTLREGPARLACKKENKEENKLVVKDFLLAAPRCWVALQTLNGREDNRICSIKDQSFNLWVDKFKGYEYYTFDPVSWRRREHRYPKIKSKPFPCWMVECNMQQKWAWESKDSNLCLTRWWRVTFDPASRG